MATSRGSCRPWGATGMEKGNKKREGTIFVHTLKYKFLLSTIQVNKSNTNLLISQRKHGFLIKLCTHLYIYVWVHSIQVH